MFGWSHLFWKGSQTWVLGNLGGYFWTADRGLEFTWYTSGILTSTALPHIIVCHLLVVIFCRRRMSWKKLGVYFTLAQSHVQREGLPVRRSSPSLPVGQLTVSAQGVCFGDNSSNLCGRFRWGVGMNKALCQLLPQIMPQWAEHEPGAAQSPGNFYRRYLGKCY